MHLPLVSSDTFFLLFCSVYLDSGFRWQNHDTAIWWLMWLAILNAFPKSSSESFIHKVFLKTLGQTSVALQKCGPKGFAILYLSLSFSRYSRTLWDSRGKGGNVGAYKQKDNETEKRGTMSKAGHGGLLFTSLYIIYTNCAPRYVSIQKMKKKQSHVYPPWVHDHSTGFSLRHRSWH